MSYFSGQKPNLRAQLFPSLLIGSPGPFSMVVRRAPTSGFHSSHAQTHLSVLGWQVTQLPAQLRLSSYAWFGMA